VAKAHSHPGTTRRSALSAVAALGVSALLLAGCTSVSQPDEPGPKLTLTVGALLPVTGTFSSLAPPQQAGIALAAQDINQAALGITVDVQTQDSGDASTAATRGKAAVAALLRKKVDVIIGATSSDVSLAVVDQITDAGVLQISPQNSAIEFTNRSDHGLYWRTAPSDLLQGAVLAKQMVKDGATSLGIIATDDDYGTGLQKQISRGFEGSGRDIVATAKVKAADTDFAASVKTVVDAKPDAVAVLASDQAAGILPALVAAGIPAKHLYLVDRDLRQYGTGIPVSLEGAAGTAAGAALDSGFRDNLLEIAPTLTNFSYAPEAYDAVVVAALGALAARSTEGTKIAAKLRQVSGGTGKGEKATDFASAAQIIRAGDVADYDGYSGGIAFDEHGDPTQAIIRIYRYGADNRFAPLK
jgi:branched-chain amino acid transport system substrate-binding protein